jgi:cell division protein FtsI/penicillin-binding protein 2
MRPTRRSRARGRGSSLLCVVVLILVLGACGGGKPTPDKKTQDDALNQAAPVARKFVATWSDPTAEKLQGIIDKPAVAAADMQSYLADLHTTSSNIDLSGDLKCTTTKCTQHIIVHHMIAGYGEWSYASDFAVHRRQGQWLVDWAPNIFYPDLSGATRLEAHRLVRVRSVIVDRDGVALTPERRIVRVGVVPKNVTKMTYTDLSGLLEIDTDALRDRVQRSQPDWFVPVIDLRRPAYLQVRRQLDAVQGVSIDRARRALGPTAAWGRAVLGSVEPATRATLKSAGEQALPTDEVGTGGLQQRFQQQLAGTPGLRVDLVEKASNAVVNTVFFRASKPGEALQTSLDLGIQTAAERAVSSAKRRTSLVVVKASTGEVLAAANAPGPTALNTAFLGRYAPGSTFKVVTSDALLDHGMTPSTPVPCPDNTIVGGTQFHNYDNGILPGGGTLARAFAVSCNTAFVSSAYRLGAGTLASAARRFGIGAKWNLGLPGYSGEVPSAPALVDRAAESIGQGKILMSPLAMAMVAASVDSGVARTPTLLPDDFPGRRIGELSARRTKQLTAMMRLAVTNGTGNVVNLAGRPVFAKTGTAEVQSGKRITTNAWMIGFRGDLAFAVIVEGGKSGAASAAPIVSDLLISLPSSAYR